MLDYVRLQLTIEIQGQCYQLLRWVSNAIDKGFIRFAKAHEYTSLGESAFEWLSEHYQNLPVETRPKQEQLQEFANFFGTYLETSFDLHREVPLIRRSECGCGCFMCSYLVQGSHLRAKKVQPRDKKRALRLMEERLSQLAGEHDMKLHEGHLHQIFAQRRKTAIKLTCPVEEYESLRRLAAYSTYGYWLLQRMEGVSDGVSILALWREIAYERAGSPIKGFQLKLEDFVEAETGLVGFLQETHY
jgi:hypothetical protein